MCIYVITMKGKQVINLRKSKGVCGKDWREENGGGNDVIIL